MGCIVSLCKKKSTIFPEIIDYNNDLKIKYKTHKNELTRKYKNKETHKYSEKYLSYITNYKT